MSKASGAAKTTLEGPRDEDRELLRRYHEGGDTNAREELIERHLPLVRSLARRYAGRGEALEDIDDLQLAVERLLAEAGTAGTVHLSFEVGEGHIRAHVGPLRERAIADALRDAEARPGELTLARILQTVVDAFGVEDVDHDNIVVRLEKLRAPL